MNNGIFLHSIGYITKNIIYNVKTPQWSDVGANYNYCNYIKNDKIGYKKVMFYDILSIFDSSCVKKTWLIPQKTVPLHKIYIQSVEKS